MRQHPGPRRRFERQTLRDEGRDDAGQRIAHAADAHAGIAIRTQLQMFAADQRASPLEYDDTAVALPQRLHGGDAVGLHRYRRQTQQACRFARMRRDDALRIRPRLLREQIQGIGIGELRLAACIDRRQ